MFELYPGAIRLFRERCRSLVMNGVGFSASRSLIRRVWLSFVTSNSFQKKTSSFCDLSLVYSVANKDNIHTCTRTHSGSGRRPKVILTKPL